jgi:hypothetical protein
MRKLLRQEGYDESVVDGGPLLKSLLMDLRKIEVSPS